MNRDQEYRHWKREQDAYLNEIGAMARIKQDPMAALGYEIRSDPDKHVLDMDSDPDRASFKYYGLYSTAPGSEPPNSKGHRTDGTMSVITGIPSDRYAKTTVHELGHVGSRNSGSDLEFAARAKSGEEERNRRFADLLLWPPGHPGHEDARRSLNNLYKGKDYMPDALAYADRVGLKHEAADIKSEKKDKEGSKPPKPRPKPEKKKKKKKTLSDYLKNWDAPEEEFGQGTRKKLDDINSSIDADFARINLRSPTGGMSYTPRLPPPREDIFSGANSFFADPSYRR